ncbi:hypothetical protein GH714_001797 [Hevea brasiliensis]|uniref:2-(3-amino-3-carboxypropyl)histidine synthase subunit 1 n=1 Tax=Hevea brasiliensis TaxID=3981 RepID=A0A6A6M6T9_HEVBR|nr:hypothetical protein GH714_001797 [Hevea brasiliensis]
MLAGISGELPSKARRTKKSSTSNSCHGGFPVIISITMQPRDQISKAGDISACFTDSGDMYKGVPESVLFASAIREAKPELEKLGLSVLIPQSKPLSAGEVLGCTAPRIPSKSVIGSFSDMVVVFVADGRFHLEAFMMANPEISAFRNDPYLGKLFLEEYDHQGMKETRRGQ